MITFTPHTSSVTALAFSPDGARLASVSNDGDIKVWEVAQLGSSEPVWEIAGVPGYGLNHAQYAPDGSVLYTGGSDGIVRAWDARDGKLSKQTDPEAEPKAVVGAINAFVVSRCGKYLAYGGGYMWHPTEFVVAHTSDFTPIRRVPGHLGAVGVFIAQENGFVTGSADCTVRLWDWNSANERGIIKLRGVIRGLGVSADGTHIAVAGGSIIHLYRAVPVGTPALKPEPDKIREFRGHTKQIHCLEFSPDGTRLASAANDSTVRVWDVASGKEVRAFYTQTRSAALGHLCPRRPDARVLQSERPRWLA